MSYQKCPKIEDYATEAVDFVDKHKIYATQLDVLTGLVEKNANTIYQTDSKNGKKTTKNKAVEKALSEIGLGKISAHLHQDSGTALDARNYILKKLVK